MTNNNSRKYCVYIHINKINNKVYIGQTINANNPKTRWQNGMGYQQVPLLWDAIQEFGWDNFDHNILKTDLTKEEADYWERYYIKQYNSTDNKFGYNMRKGGQPLRTIPPEEEIKIVDTYTKCGSVVQTSALTNHNQRVVSRILKNNGFDFFNINPEEIVYLYNQEGSIKRVREITNHACSTIKNILDEYGIEVKYINHKYDIEDDDILKIIQKYNEGYNIENIANDFKSKYDFISSYHVTKILKNHGVNTSRFLDQKLNVDDVANKYYETKSIKVTAKYFKVDRERLRLFMIEHNIKIDSKNTQMSIKCKFDNKEMTFDNIMACAKYLIDNEIVDNKSERALRDLLSKAMKKQVPYKNIMIERTM